MFSLFSSAVASRVFCLGCSFPLAIILFVPPRPLRMSILKRLNCSSQLLPISRTPSGSPPMYVESQIISASRPKSFRGEVRCMFPVAAPDKPRFVPMMELSAERSNRSMLSVMVSFLSSEAFPLRKIRCSELVNSRASTSMSDPCIVR